MSSDNAAEPLDRETLDRSVDEAAQAVLQRDEAPSDAPPPRARTIAEVARQNGYRVNAPARPDLQPGESVTTVPDRWCPNCQQARAGRKCGVCRTICTRRVEIEDAEEYERGALVSVRDPGRSFFARAGDGGSLEREEAEDLDGEELEEFEELEELEEPQRYQARAGAAPQRTRAQPAPRNQRTPPAKGRNVMSRGQGNTQRSRLVRRGGQVEHISGRPNLRAVQGTAEEQLSALWQNGSVNKELWFGALNAAIAAHKPMNADDVAACADIADAAYIEMMLRENAG